MSQHEYHFDVNHEYQFEVYGDDGAEIERKAAAECLRYFGHGEYRCSVDAEALMSVSGTVLAIRARVRAVMLL